MLGRLGSFGGGQWPGSQSYPPTRRMFASCIGPNVPVFGAHRVKGNLQASLQRQSGAMVRGLGATMLDDHGHRKHPMRAELGGVLQNVRQ
jgi:hypothetical protein